MLPGRLRNAAHALFQVLQLPEPGVTSEIDEMKQLVVGKTLNRSVLGSMNDIADHCRWHAANRESLNPRALELELAEMPAEPLDFKFPREQAAALLGAA